MKSEAGMPVKEENIKKETEEPAAEAPQQNNKPRMKALVGNRASRSSELNAFRDALSSAPESVRAEFKRIDDMPSRSGKRAMKTAMINEFLKNESFETPFFKKFKTVEQECENIQEQQWVSWSQLVLAEGEASAKMQFAKQAIPMRRHPRIPADADIEEPEKYQYKLPRDLVRGTNRTVEGKQISQEHEIAEGDASTVNTQFADIIEASPTDFSMAKAKSKQSSPKDKSEDFHAEMF